MRRVIRCLDKLARRRRKSGFVGIRPKVCSFLVDWVAPRDSSRDLHVICGRPISTDFLLFVIKQN